MAGKEQRCETGRRGEEVAEKFLQQMGLRTLDKNWRAGHREIDLIMEWSDGIHFIEVKTLRAPNIREPYENISRKKQLLLLSAARAYLASARIYREALFDVVSVVIDGEDAKVDYFPDAFSPNW